MKLLPPNVSSFPVDPLFKLIFFVVGFWFLLAEVVLLYFLFRYRRRGGSERGAHLPATSVKWLSWVLVPGALVMLCDFFIDEASSKVWLNMKRDRPQSALHIRITAQQFYWKFQLPGRDGKLFTADDITALNQLTLPLGQPVVFELESKDVLHSFFVPSLRLKQDAVPGRKILGWFQAKERGDYQILCAELCGIGHSAMHGMLHILSPKEYDRWLAEKSP